MLKKLIIIIILFFLSYQVSAATLTISTDMAESPPITNSTIIIYAESDVKLKSAQLLVETPTGSKTYIDMDRFRNDYRLWGIEYVPQNGLEGAYKISATGKTQSDETIYSGTSQFTVDYSSPNLEPTINYKTVSVDLTSNENISSNFDVTKITFDQNITVPPVPFTYFNGIPDQPRVVASTKDLFYFYFHNPVVYDEKFGYVSSGALSRLIGKFYDDRYKNWNNALILDKEIETIQDLTNGDGDLFKELYNKLGDRWFGPGIRFGKSKTGDVFIHQYWFPTTVVDSHGDAHVFYRFYSTDIDSPYCTISGIANRNIKKTGLESPPFELGNLKITRMQDGCITNATSQAECKSLGAGICDNYPPQDSRNTPSPKAVIDSKDNIFIFWGELDVKENSAKDFPSVLYFSKITPTGEISSPVKIIKYNDREILSIFPLMLENGDIALIWNTIIYKYDSDGYRIYDISDYHAHYLLIKNTGTIGEIKEFPDTLKLDSVKLSPDNSIYLFYYENDLVSPIGILGKVEFSGGAPTIVKIKDDFQLNDFGSDEQNGLNIDDLGNYHIFYRYDELELDTRLVESYYNNQFNYWDFSNISLPNGDFSGLPSDLAYSKFPMSTHFAFALNNFLFYKRYDESPLMKVTYPDLSSKIIKFNWVNSEGKKWNYSFNPSEFQQQGPYKLELMAFDQANNETKIERAILVPFNVLGCEKIVNVRSTELKLAPNLKADVIEINSQDGGTVFSLPNYPTFYSNKFYVTKKEISVGSSKFPAGTIGMLKDGVPIISNKNYVNYSCSKFGVGDKIPWYVYFLPNQTKQTPQGQLTSDVIVLNSKSTASRPYQFKILDDYSTYDFIAILVNNNSLNLEEGTIIYNVLNPITSISKFKSFVYSGCCTYPVGGGPKNIGGATAPFVASIPFFNPLFVGLAIGLLFYFIGFYMIKLKNKR